MDWTSWPASPSYVPLMQELLHFAIAGRMRERAVTVGDTLEQFLPGAGNAADFTMQVLGQETLETGRTQVQDDGAVLRWTDTDISGIYRATIGQQPQEYLFAVNVPAATEAQQASESDLTRTTEEEIKKLYPEWQFQLVTDPRRATHSGNPPVPGGTGSPPVPGGIIVDETSEPPGSGIAQWLLLAMFVFLVVEVVLAWQFGHFSTVADSHDAPPARGRLLPGLAAGFAAVVFMTLGGVLLHALWTGDFLGFLPDATRRSMETGVYAPRWLCRCVDACDPGIFPTGFQHALALAPDLPPPAPGESPSWRLEFQWCAGLPKWLVPYVWEPAADPWIAGALALLVIFLVWYVYHLEGRSVSPAYALVMIALRAELVLLAFVVFLGQVHVQFDRKGWPDLAIIIDDSHSMSTVDHYRDAEVVAAAEELAQSASLSSPERLQLARALLTHGKPAWLEVLWTQRHVKIHLYHCSSRAARLSDVTAVQHLAPATAALDELHADASNDSSQLGTAVRQVLNDFRGSSLSAIIMFTDGVTTEGEDLVKASRYASQMGVPLYFVGIGDAQAGATWRCTICKSRTASTLTIAWCLKHASPARVTPT